MNECSMTRNLKERKFSDALDESPMTHADARLSQINDLPRQPNESSKTFRICSGSCVTCFYK